MPPGTPHPPQAGSPTRPVPAGPLLRSQRPLAQAAFDSPSLAFYARSLPGFFLTVELGLGQPWRSLCLLKAGASRQSFPISHLHEVSEPRILVTSIRNLFVFH